MQVIHVSLEGISGIIDFDARSWSTTEKSTIPQRIIRILQAHPILGEQVAAAFSLRRLTPKTGLFGQCWRKKKGLVMVASGAILAIARPSIVGSGFRLAGC